MAEEAQEDRVEFKTVDGQSFRKVVPAGQGHDALQEAYEATWVRVDNETMIRADKIVSIRLWAYRSEPPLVDIV